MTTVRTLGELEGDTHANVFPDSEPKTVRLALDEGEEVPPHSHPGREVVFFLVDGRVDLRLGVDAHELTAGDVARFDGGREISPRAVEASTALVVLAARTDG